MFLSSIQAHKCITSASQTWSSVTFFARICLYPCYIAIVVMKTRGYVREGIKTSCSIASIRVGIQIFAIVSLLIYSKMSR